MSSFLNRLQLQSPAAHSLLRRPSRLPIAVASRCVCIHDLFANHPSPPYPSRAVSSKRAPISRPIHSYINYSRVYQKHSIFSGLKPISPGSCLKSSFGSTTTICIVTLVGVILLTCSYPVLSSHRSAESIDKLYGEGEQSITFVQGEDSTMSGEPLPGRPGNLSAEQEEKLRELWVATLQVFGVHNVPEARDLIAHTHGGKQNGNAQKTKKKRLSLFNRKGKGSDVDSADSSPQASPTSASAEGEDKYGQTKQFHDTLAHQSPESLRATFWSMVKHDHPDALLLRFLRARKWDVENALIMMISTMNWRLSEMHVDEDVMREGEAGALRVAESGEKTTNGSGADFLAQMQLGKSFVHGVDKMGRPICCVRARLHKQGEQSEESLERYTVFVIETTRLILSPPIDTACVLFDMTGFSMANMDYSPVKFMIKCFEANYPESLGVVLVHKAPWVFQGIWKIIKGWLDPVVASKVNFTNSVEDLEEYIRRDRIMKDLGGDEDWSYEYVEPSLDENPNLKDTETRDKLLSARDAIVKEYEAATLEWIHEEEGQDPAETKSKREAVATKLRDDYWKLDPYVRATSFYDRTSVINPGGKIDFYPTKATTPAVEKSSQIATNSDDVD